MGLSLGESAGTREWLRETTFSTVGLDKADRARVYAKLLELVANPSLPEFTLSEATVYAKSICEGGLRVGGLFPSDIVIAARSLKLTRRLFRVADSRICSEQGLWLKKGVNVARGSFVGFYVGWVYSESDKTAVWEQEYLDNSYSLGLQGIEVAGAMGEA